MVKMSTRGKYGIKAMVDLAMNYGGGCISASKLAQQQGISESYLEQLMASLKKAGLVMSSRGANGGYYLALPPETVSVGRILRALEGSTDVMDCVSGESSESSPCSKSCLCSARPLWLKLQRSIDQVLDETTLADMAEDYKIQISRLNNAEKRK